MTDIDEALRRIHDKRARCLAMNLGTHSDHPDESYFDLRLPEEYRRYLGEVANGGMGPAFYPIWLRCSTPLSMGADASDLFRSKGRA